MSRRTSEASRAIAGAWANEQDLVRNGQGTRDWTPEQQRDILEKGKAYDDNGKAFEGHHMKSAEEFPEYQGDPENIQLLSRAEHFDAHGGNFQNPTNGYYDPDTGETTDFGPNKYEPCKIIELSNPIENNQTENEDETMGGLDVDEPAAEDKGETMSDLVADEASAPETASKPTQENEENNDNSISM